MFETATSGGDNLNTPFKMVANKSVGRVATVGGKHFQACHDVCGLVHQLLPLSANRCIPTFPRTNRVIPVPKGNDRICKSWRHSSSKKKFKDAD
jgi:hypothetical protein